MYSVLDILWQGNFFCFTLFGILDGKHQLDVTTCAVSSDASYLLNKMVTSEYHYYQGWIFPHHLYHWFACRSIMDAFLDSEGYVQNILCFTLHIERAGMKLIGLF